MDKLQYRNKVDNPYEDYINKAKSLCESYKNNSYYIKSVNFGKSDSTAKDINKNCEMSLTVISAKEIKEQEQWQTKIDKLMQKMIKDREKRNKKK